MLTPFIEALTCEIFATLIIDLVNRRISRKFSQLKNPLNCALKDTKKHFAPKYNLRLDLLKNTLTKHKICGDSDSIYQGGFKSNNFDRLKQYLLDNESIRLPGIDPEQAVTEIIEYLHDRFIFRLSQNKNLFGPLVVALCEDARKSHEDLKNEIHKILPTQRSYMNVLHQDHTRIEDELESVKDRLDSTYFVPKISKEQIDREIEKQLSIMKQARFFRRYPIKEKSIILAENIENGDFQYGSSEVKSRALAWCARFLSVDKNNSKSNDFLNLAKQLDDGPEIKVAEAFRVSAEGDLESALGKLVDINSAFAMTAKFMIVCHHKDSASAIEWLLLSGINYSELDADGKLFLINKQFELCHWDKAFEYSTKLQDKDFQQTPFLFYVSALANLVKVVPDELKSSILQQVPLEVRNFPLSSIEDSLKARRKAGELFTKFSLKARELDCVEDANLADDYSLWLELRDPESFNSGVKRLKESMSDPTNSLRRLNFALKYGIKLDLFLVEQEILRQETLSGGSSLDTAIARFSLAFTKDSPEAIVDYIDLYLDQICKYMKKKYVVGIEIEILAKAGFTQRAEDKFKKLIDIGLTDAEKNHLHTIIAESTLVDSIKTLRDQFECSNNLADLASFVNLLEEKKEWPMLCHFGALLFQRTKDLSDFERLAMSLNKANLHSDLFMILKKYPEFLDQSDNLKRLWIWTLYLEGLFLKASTILEKLKSKYDNPNDRLIIVKLAIASGQWNTLPVYIENEWVNRKNRQADELIRTAQLANYVGSPRSKDLAQAAAIKGASNASILATAYLLAIKAGWEDEPSVEHWLQNAIKLSEKDGPFYKMSVKEIWNLKPKWDRQKTATLQQLYKGDIPICGAAMLLNRSLSEMILLPSLGNTSEQDPRRRVLIPAFSGVRRSLPCNYRVIAMDATAILTLGILGLLETVANSFEHIVIPHSTGEWLFEENQNVAFHQPIRIKNAKKLSLLLTGNAIKSVTGSATIDPDLAAEVGEELASLIAEVIMGSSDDQRQRIVVRSSPVHRISSLMEEEADLSAYYSNICSCQSVANKLAQKGLITASELLRARTYLSQEKEWPAQPELSDGALLYLDDLSVSYLQHTGLIEKLQPAGFEVYISKHKIKEITALQFYESFASTAICIIEKIRNFLETGIKSGKISVGKFLHLNMTENSTFSNHPTIAIIDLAKDVEAIIVDDRSLNQHLNVSFDSSYTPILTTLDLINSLHSRGKITLDQMLEYRTQLRRACFLFVPITCDELQHHISTANVINGQLFETAELKAIRENVLQIRMSHFFQHPKEAPWLTSLMHALSQTLKAQWTSENNEETICARSEWLLQLFDVRGWAPFFCRDDGLRLIEQGYSKQIMSLLIMPPTISPELKKKYWEWIEERVLGKLQAQSPELYSLLVERAKDIISDTLKQTTLRRAGSDK